VLSIGRATTNREEKRRGPRYAKADDRVVRAQIREVIRTRATYGSRWLEAAQERSSTHRARAYGLGAARSLERALVQ
jgi:hypothetical protein